MRTLIVPKPFRRPAALTAVGGVLASLVVALPGSAGAAAPVESVTVPDATPASTASAATAPPVAWTPTSEPLRTVDDGLARAARPSSYAGFTLDLDALQPVLDRAPMESARGAEPVVVAIPAPTGELVRFAIQESPVMEAGLAALHPDITTYAGRSLDGPAATIRLDSTPLGVHASVRGVGPAFYVEPAYVGNDQGDDALYLSYFTVALPEDGGVQETGYAEMAAEAEREARREARGADSSAGAERILEGAGNRVVSRTYRVALSTDPTFATYYSGNATTPEQVNTNVTAAKATIMNRVNQLYGDDMSLRMLLVAETDKTNFNTQAAAYEAGGRCGAVACYTATDVANGCSATLLNRNREVLGVVVGAEDYDIGHIGLGLNGGGIAGLGVVGLAGKARGCTGLTTPTGDFYAVDYVAHEFGHQFGGNHTFDGTLVSCAASNRSAANSVEPGSGTSVMAYAGICAQDNLQPHSDPYFSQRSQTEIGNHVTSTKAVANEISTVQLVGFDATDSFTLTFPGLGTTAPITNGTNYSAAGIKAAIEAVTSGTATVGAYMAGAAFDANGFQVTFSGTRAGTRLPNPVVNVVSGTFTGQGNDVVQGGPPTNGGISQEVSTNRVPSVTAPGDKTIPTRTPFELTGAATDPDGDRMLYLWEQNDPGTVNGTPLATVARPAGALFRVFGTYATVTAADTIKYNSPGQNLAGSNPVRTFPDIEQVIAGSTNAQNGTCPTPTAPTPTVPPSTSTNQSFAPGPFLDCISELLPTAAYEAGELNFRFTARDLGGADGGYDGGTTFDDVKLSIDATAGPFLVSSQPTATTVAGRAPGTVTWDVAGTNTAAMATNVKITFSTDGGRTYPITLLASTPNDGTQAITWPNVATTKGRIRVQAVDNYFFDLNNADITVNAVPELTVGGNTPATFTAQHSDALSPTPVVTASSATADGSTITATATGLPEGLRLSKVSSSATGTRPGTARFEVLGTTTGDAGSFPVTVTVNDGAAAAQQASFTVVVTKEDAAVTYTGPTRVVASRTGTDATDVTLTADVTEQADGSLGGLTGTTATFTDRDTSEVLCTAPVQDGRAACSFGADLPAGSGASADRTYRVLVTLGGNRYVGATPEASTLVVEHDPGLTVSDPVAETGADYSDALDPAIRLEAGSRYVESPAITAEATGLPSGLSLTRVEESGAGVLPGSVRLAVTGTTTDAPGLYPVTIRVDDGRSAAVSRTVTVRVTREDATATYTGPTQVVTRERGSSTAPVTLSADVAQADDGTPGDLTLATASFTDATGATLCTSPVTSAGKASCQARLDAPASGDGSYDVSVTVGGRYAGATTSPTTVRVLVDEGLALTEPTSSTPSAQYTDAPSPTTSLTATARFVPADDFDVTTAGLPAGLTLTASDATQDGALPGRATYTVTGTTTAAPGTYPVTVTLADGDHDPVTRSLVVTVTREEASVAYTGPSRVAAAAAAEDTSKQFTMSARVTDLATTPGSSDTTVGDVTTATVTFRDTATDTVLCAEVPVTLVSTGVGQAACSVTAELPADDGRTYRVALSVGGRYAATSSADAPVVVDQADAPVGDTTAPQTSITAGPTPGQIVLSRDVTFGYASSEPGSTFTCSLSGTTGVCPASGSVTGRGLQSGSYDFRVAATDAAGNTDATPSTRRFYIPTDDRALTATRGPWLRRSSADTYRRTYTTVARQGSELRFSMTPSRSLSLVVTRGRAYGSVDVFLGNRRLRTIDLAASTERTQVLVAVARFASATSGTVRIVTRTDRAVRIEGLAATAVAATSPARPAQGRSTLG